MKSNSFTVLQNWVIFYLRALPSISGVERWGPQTPHRQHLYTFPALYVYSGIHQSRISLAPGNHWGIK